MEAERAGVPLFFPVIFGNGSLSARDIPERTTSRLSFLIGRLRRAHDLLPFRVGDVAQILRRGIAPVKSVRQLPKWMQIRVQ